MIQPTPRNISNGIFACFLLAKRVCYVVKNKSTCVSCRLCSMLSAEKKWISWAKQSHFPKDLILTHPITNEAYEGYAYLTLPPIRQKRKVQRDGTQTVPKRRAFRHGAPPGHFSTSKPQTLLSPAVPVAVSGCEKQEGSMFRASSCPALLQTSRTTHPQSIVVHRSRPRTASLARLSRSAMDSFSYRNDDAFARDAGLSQQRQGPAIHISLHTQLPGNAHDESKVSSFWGEKRISMDSLDDAYDGCFPDDRIANRRGGQRGCDDKGGQRGCDTNLLAKTMSKLSKLGSIRDDCPPPGLRETKKLNLYSPRELHAPATRVSVWPTTANGLNRTIGLPTSSSASVGSLDSVGIGGTRMQCLEMHEFLSGGLDNKCFSMTSLTESIEALEDMRPQLTSSSRRFGTHRGDSVADSEDRICM